MITSDEIVEEGKKRSQQILMKKVAFKICLFINYGYIIDSCQYLLLSDKILGKTKKFIPMLCCK